MVILVTACYLTNQIGDGRHFVQRVLCVGWTEVVRFSIGCCGLAVLTIVYRSDLAIGTLGVLLLLGCSVRLWFYVGWISRASDEAKE